jgi:dephospho-CoA kinase
VVGSYAGCTLPPSEKRIPIVGLTGAVAAGKSTALEALRRLGAATLSADAVVHELLATERVRDLLVARWGAEIAPEGEVDRARVAAIVFEDQAELAWLETTLHPLVGERVGAWHNELSGETRLAVVEVPLLFEAGMESEFDATICVVAPEEVRAGRARGRGTSAIEGRAQRQLSQEEKAARATYVVGNEGTPEELEAQLARLVSELTAERETPA